MDECQQESVEIIPLTSIGLVSVSCEIIVGNHCVGTATEMHNSQKYQTERNKYQSQFLPVRDRQVRYLPQAKKEIHLF